MTNSTQRSSFGRVLIVEGNVTGHRLAYVRILLDAAFDAGFEVFLALPHGADLTPEYATHISSSRSQHSRCEIPVFDLATITDAARRLEATRTVVPDGDGLVVAVVAARGWDAPGSLSLLIMREFAQHRRSRIATALRSSAKSMLFKRLRRIANVDAFVLRGAAAHAASGVDHVVVDPVQVDVAPPVVEELRARWDIKDDEFVYAVLGAIDERKNVDLVLGSILHGVEAGAFSMRPSVLVAGRFAEGMSEQLELNRAALAQHGVRAIFEDSTLPSHEFDAAVALADCLVLAYSNDGPSGLLGKAAAVGTRIVTAGSPTLKRECAAIGPGAVWSPLTSETISTSLVGIQAMAPPAGQDYRTPTDFANRLLGIIPG